jgi:flagellar assembly protein FliH
LSKIIKPHEQAEVTTFDFHEIEKTESPFQLRGMSHADHRAESLTDPLVELESTIQKRLLEAERKAQEIEKEAYERGYAQGEKDGIEYGRKSMQITKERMEQLLGGLAALPEKVFKDYREWFLTTSLAVARRLVIRELTTQPEAFAQLVDSLLAEAEAGQSVTISINPSDLDMMRKHTDFQAIEEGSGRAVVIKPDPQLERGGCRLESDIQLLDASMDARFALLEEARLHHGPDNS